MSADLRRMHPSLKVHYHTFSSTRTLITSSRSFDYFTQFLPFANDPSSKSLSSINSNERRKVTVGLSRLIKKQQGYALKEFSRRFCPLLLAQVMKLLGSRETAFGFFKLALRDDSEQIVRSCCIVAHLLAGENLRFLAQDVVSCVIAKIEPSRSRHLVGFMWASHCEYESDFSVLDTLMRGFLKAEMGLEALEIVSRMRKVGVKAEFVSNYESFQAFD
ncbi:hypothetical protein L3X38_003362 [Prunus dulcis]|uniref:Pentatricopeptide repeat superfamily protein n=1 Tax=Prunus dulcis TaxID=3755 RepID=A0AAD4ZLX3_PRUDU|nr:hypothetical protein L3X38_003362 [Prunus dulcis]